MRQLIEPRRVLTMSDFAHPGRSPASDEGSAIASQLISWPRHRWEHVKEEHA